MKKKLLSLVLAGAMVASTSVSAFAETVDTAEYSIGKQGQDHQVEITGDVQNTKGDVVEGTISVTVPTAMAFTITKDGTIEGGTIKVVNKSKQQVEVVAKEFKDTTPSSGIVIVKENDLDSKLREEGNSNSNSKRYISLKLTGTGGSVGLVSNKSGDQTGFIDEEQNEITNNGNQPYPSLGSAWEGNNVTLTLSGRAKSNTESEAYRAPESAIQDKFNLVLKIQKTTK